MEYRIFTDSYKLIADLSAISSFIGLLISITGLIISIVLIFEAKAIRKSFIGKVRFPESLQELRTLYTSIDSNMSDFTKNQDMILREFYQVKSIVENFKSKSSQELVKKECKDFVDNFKSTNIFRFKTKKPTFNEQECIQLLRELSGLITALDEYIKDFKLRN